MVQDHWPVGSEPQFVTTLCYSWTQSHGGDSAVDRGWRRCPNRYGSGARSKNHVHVPMSMDMCIILDNGPTAVRTRVEPGGIIWRIRSAPGPRHGPQHASPRCRARPRRAAGHLRRLRARHGVRMAAVQRWRTSARPAAWSVPATGMDANAERLRARQSISRPGISSTPAPPQTAEFSRR